ncbi:hypothetical protein ACFTWN_08335 [Streptomyces sp. NPDC057092]|uniref:hypothetical protein n=1 Tax=Streptomyces sp. NPDC057092 TaxID=3346017 RepID=UPI0036393327
MTRPRDWATGGGLLGLDDPGEWAAAFARGERDRLPDTAQRGFARTAFLNRLRRDCLTFPSNC